MVKGGKRYASMDNDGKWFAHLVLPENESRNRETSTSTGLMLTQVKSSLPQAFNFTRYSKQRAQQEPKEFPFSNHDNRHTLKDISVFSHGVGRRKYFHNHGQHVSHFCLCHDGAENSTVETRKGMTVYQTDFIGKQEAAHGPTGTRRFPRNHQQKSAEAALAQAGECFMWFGRDGCDPSVTELSAANPSASSKTLL